ncbi:hypothetical protein SAMN04488117_102470 [Celeribacter baekdonensis]|uniref:Uncharacterized protein n=1 Tax=Celeribacter baekdonensis TaxID=875171 RepID=A0A1G7IW23_9RHOB|nr:hypothetical protein [Celeribacter baekdonensis]SDF16509.1 hypothetical protein SAMN04488117_102470 [Celeribacter baekdonensis]
MTNVAGVPAFGGGGFAFRQPPDPPRPAVPQVAQTATDGSATFTKGNELPGQNGSKYTKSDSAVDTANDAAAPQSTDAKSEMQNRIKEDLPKDILTGPTPAFQASVLEVESDLRNVIAQFEARRNHVSDEAAISATPRGPESRSQAVQPLTSEGTGAETQRAATAEATQAEVQKDATEATQALVQTSPEAMDPETRYAGPAANPRSPYDPA